MGSKEVSENVSLMQSIKDWFAAGHIFCGLTWIAQGLVQVCIFWVAVQLSLEYILPIACASIVNMFGVTYDSAVLDVVLFAAIPGVFIACVVLFLCWKLLCFTWRVFDGFFGNLRNSRVRYLRAKAEEQAEVAKKSNSDTRKDKKSHE